MTAQSVVRLEGEHADKVIKYYGRKRRMHRQWMVQLGHWTFAGKTRAWAAARRDNELACIRLWREHGFDTFAPVSPEGMEIPRSTTPHLVLEYAPGARLYDVLLHGEDESVAERALARFGTETSRRHALALSLREPRLLHEHGTFRHVHLSGDRLIYFDFEISWRRRHRVGTLAGREFASFLTSLARASHERDRFRPRLEVLIAHYADHAQLTRLIAPHLEAAHRASRALFAGRKKRRDVYRRTRVLEAAREALRTHAGR